MLNCAVLAEKDDRARLLPGFTIRLRFATRFNRFAKALVQIRVSVAQIFDDIEVFLADAGQIQLLNVHQAQQFTHRLRHVAAAFITRATTLGHTDLSPEFLLVQTKFATDIAGIQMTANQPTANSKGLRLGSFDQIRGIIDEELEAIWSGDKSAKEAMDSAKKRGDALLRRFESANR